MEKAISSYQRTDNLPFYQSWLTNGIKSWVLFILAGQWMFALYITVQFASPLVAGTLNESQFSHMIEGYVNGDTFNNKVLLLHIIPVIIISLSATFQLFPAVRKHFPGFHRWNGRVFLTIGIIGALTGLYLTWGRGTRLSDIGAIGITVSGILVPVFAVLVWRFAVKRDFAQHRRFAVHAFIVINAVWTLRLYLMAWYLLTRGGYGNNATMDGPADLAISFACYLLPMAVAEMAFLAEKKRRANWTLSAAILVSVASLITLVGVGAATMMMWIPRIAAGL